MAVSGRHCSKLARRPSELRRPDFKSEERRTAWVWRIPSNAQARDRLLTAARDGRLAAALQRKTAANGACFHGCSPRKTRRLSLPCQVSEDLLMSLSQLFLQNMAGSGPSQVPLLQDRTSLEEIREKVGPWQEGYRSQVSGGNSPPAMGTAQTKQPGK